MINHRKTQVINQTKNFQQEIRKKILAAMKKAGWKNKPRPSIIAEKMAQLYMRVKQKNGENITR